jgi:hypothetical protein
MAWLFNILQVMTEKTKPAKSPPLTLAAYQRLHNVIQSLSNNFANGPAHSCIFFSILGAVLMQKHYNLNAKVFCGGAAVMLDEQHKTTLSWFALDPDGFITVGPTGFHAWISCDGWLIDLTAPNYHEMFESHTSKILMEGYQSIPSINVPRMMLQKPIAETEGQFNQIRKVGDCIFFPDQDLTTMIIDNAFEQVKLTELITIASAWHRPLPRQMAPTFSIGNIRGEIETISLINRELEGKW